MTAVQVVQVKQINPLLAKYLQSLATRPLLTKSTTSLVAGFLSELAAGYISGVTPPPLPKSARTGIAPLDWARQNEKAFKLALYGFFVSAPLGHFLLAQLQKAFAGKDSARAKILMIVCANLFVSPIQQSAYLISMAIINGVNVQKFVQASFLPVMKLTWIVSPLSMAFAQKVLSPEQWVPFFTLVSASVGTFINANAKKAGLAAREKAKRDAEKKQ